MAGVFFAGANHCLAQDDPAARIRNYLADTGGLTDKDLAGLDRGKIVTRHLPVKDKRELAVIGVFSIQSPVDDVLSGFDRAISRQRRKSSRAFGRFSDPPKLEDLKSMTLRESEIEDLKSCTVGKCKLRLSAEMIESFRNEIDWDAKNYKAETNRLYRQMLFEYVKDYLARGDDALIEYRHKRAAGPLKKELHALHDRLIWIDDFAPEFSRYHKEFPENELSNVEDMIRWAVVNVAFKPVITITHISVYTKEEDGISQRLVISKQIYANHHFDGSVSLTALANIQDGGETSTTYFLHANHSRVSALGGGLGGLVRGLAEDRAIGRLETVLKDTRRYARSPSDSLDEEPPPADAGFLERLWEWKFLVLTVAAFVVLAGLILLMTRRGRG